MLDEPESGVDLESIVVIGDTINSSFGQAASNVPVSRPHQKILSSDHAKSALVITHTGHILDYITADKGQVLYNGILCCSRNAREILKVDSENTDMRSASDVQTVDNVHGP